MKRTVIVGLIAAAALQHGAVVSAAPASREAVRLVLRGHEQVRLSAEDWRKLGDDVDLRLAEAAADPTLVFGARQRALGALGTLGGPRAKASLDGFLAARDVPAPLLSSAVQAYAHGFGKDEPAEARRLGEALLEHSDWQVRRGAVRALGTLGGEASRTVLQTREARESHPAVRSAIRSALRSPAR